MTELKVLSGHQPWWSLIAIGVKTIETRSWATKHRGHIGFASTASVPAAHKMVGGFVWGRIGDGSFVLQDLRTSGVYDDKRNVSAPLGALLATANLVDCVPIIDGSAPAGDDRRPVVAGWGKTLTYFDADVGSDKDVITIDDQLPYGDFTPGRWAWLLDDVKPTTERCPACWDAAPRAAPGVCVDIDGYWWHTPGSCHYCEDACKFCEGGTQRVDPIPVTGHQGLWTWRGEVRS